MWGAATGSLPYCLHPYGPHPVAPTLHPSLQLLSTRMVSRPYGEHSAAPPPPLQPSGPHQDPLGWTECVGLNRDGGMRPHCGEGAARAAGLGGRMA